MPIIVNLDVMMAKRKISLGELAERIDLTPANLSILKTGKAKAIRFSTLEAICKELKSSWLDLNHENQVSVIFLFVSANKYLKWVVLSLTVLRKIENLC